MRPVSAGAMLWRSGGRSSLSVIVKATFSFVEEGLAELVAPAPLAHEERFAREGGPSSLLEDLDLIPYKPQVDVTFVGSVHAAHPVQAIRARIAVVGAQDGIDKSIQAVGDRAGPGSPPQPFRQLALGWERAWGSAENPIGVPPGGPYQASIVDPQRPGATVGLGPIPRSWGGRSRLLGSFDPRALFAEVPEVPQGFPWDYYQSAPRDQRLGRLGGSETIMLENLLEGRPRMRTRLPSARGRARLHAPWLSDEGQEVELSADTLAIDGDVQSASIVWRASVPLPHGEASLQAARLVCGVEMPGFPMPWAGATGSGTYPRAPIVTQAAAHPTAMPRHDSSGGMQAIRRESTQGLQAVGARPPSHSGLPRAYEDDESAPEGTAVLDVEGSRAGARLLTPPRSSPGVAAPPAAAAAQGTGTMALTPEDAMRLLQSAPRHMPFPGEGPHPGPAPLPVVPPPLAEPPPPAPMGTTMRSSGFEAGGGGPYPPRAPQGPPPPPPGGGGEEPTRQMALSGILDETTASLLGELSKRDDMSRPSSAAGPVKPAPAPPPAVAPPPAASTMALTPEQAAAMLATAAARHATPAGGFPPPAGGYPAPATPGGFPAPAGGFPAPPARVAPGQSPPPADVTLRSAGHPAPRPPPAPPPPDDDVDASGATFALTPEDAMRMMEEAARKKPR